LFCAVYTSPTGFCFFAEERAAVFFADDDAALADALAVVARFVLEAVLPAVFFAGDFVAVVVRRLDVFPPVVAVVACSPALFAAPRRVEVVPSW